MSKGWGYQLVQKFLKPKAAKSKVDRTSASDCGYTSPGSKAARPKNHRMIDEPLGKKAVERIDTSGVLGAGATVKKPKAHQ